jgi:hypothetical protein
MLLRRLTKLLPKLKARKPMRKKLTKRNKMPRKLMMLQKPQHQKQPMRLRKPPKLQKLTTRKLQLPHQRLVLCKSKIALANQDMTGVFTISPAIISVVNTKETIDKAHTQTTDGQTRHHLHHLLYRETEKISPTKALMRKSMVSSEQTKI